MFVAVYLSCIKKANFVCFGDFILSSGLSFVCRLDEKAMI